MRVKLVIQVDGDEAYDFLRDVEQVLAGWWYDWNTDNPKAVKIVRTSLDFGW